MIGLDTNVLIRYIVRDDQPQAAAATKLIESRCTSDDPGLINRIVLCELVWVLGRGYEYDRKMIARVVRRILTVQEFRVDGAESAWRAISLFEQGKADFADYLIGLSNHDDKAEVTYTFDRTAAESGLFKLVPRS
ncbi:MAG: type II toxin-antitoxin system VapC family toxin [Deltaproteobacteria bacterium]|nr:type II toxin-antitoxin system VapC family toxin [Deltaproteobacteria bacterium]